MIKNKSMKFYSTYWFSALENLSVDEIKVLTKTLPQYCHVCPVERLQFINGQSHIPVYARDFVEYTVYKMCTYVMLKNIFTIIT